MSNGEAGPIDATKFAVEQGLGAMAMLGTELNQDLVASVTQQTVDRRGDDLLRNQGRLAERPGPFVVQTNTLVEQAQFASDALVAKVGQDKRLVVEYLSAFATASSHPSASLVILPAPLPDDPAQLVDQVLTVPLPLTDQTTGWFQGAHLSRLYIDGPRELRFAVNLWTDASVSTQVHALLLGLAGAVSGDSRPRATATLLVSGWVTDI